MVVLKPPLLLKLVYVEGFECQQVLSSTEIKPSFIGGGREGLCYRAIKIFLC